MANPKAQIYPIPLQGEGSEINLTTYKTDISQFNGFNSKNAPFYGGTLSPMWYRKEDTISTGLYIAPNGDKYYVNNGKLYKNDIAVMSFSNKFFSSIIRDEDYYDYRSEDFYIKKRNSGTVAGTVEYVLQTPYGSTTVSRFTQDGDVNTYLYKYVNYDVALYCAIIDNGIHIFHSNGTEETKEIPILGSVPTYACICNAKTNADTNCLTFYVNAHIILYNGYSLSSSTDLDYTSSVSEENNFLYVSDDGDIYKYTYTYTNPSDNKNYPLFEFLRPDSQRTTLMTYTSFTNLYTRVKSTADTNETSRATEVADLSNLTTPKTVRKIKPTGMYFTQYREGNTLNNVHGHKVKNLYTFAGMGDKFGNIANFTKDSEGYINNPFGYVYRRDSWRLLYNNGIIQNISYSEGFTKRGTIVAPWFSISNDKNIYVENDKVIFYSDELRKWVEVRILSYGSNKFTVVDNNYIIVNTTSFDNTYIISDNKIEHFADDWNNRIGPYIGLDCAVHYLDDFDTAEVYVASAVNPRYEITGSPFCSTIMNPVSVRKTGTYNVSTSSKEDMHIANYGTLGYSPVDVYIDMNYAYSVNVYSMWGAEIYSSNTFSNILLEGTAYPTDTSGNIFMNIPILFEYIPTATNQDLIKLLGNIVYPISYYNNQLIFLISQNAENSIYGITDSFVIQGQPYAIANNKIVRYTISNSVITEAVAVMDISGLTYISATPYQAIFWSETNRTFYSFTGDRLINPVFQADSITTVGNKCIYNPATGSVIIPTNLGLFFLGIESQFILDKINDVVNIYLMNNAIAVVTSEYVYYLSYNELEGYTAWPIKLDTKFYGLGNNMLSINDTLYMMLFDNNPSKGQVKLKVTTLTNIGMTTEEKVINIKESDWDKITNTYYLRYQPKNQRSIGASYHIESDFRIGSISIGNKPDTIQISNNNF